MPLPLDIIEILHSGKAVACELSAENPLHRAFVMVIPQVPGVHKQPELWLNAGRIGGLPYALGPTLRDSASISGYEIRYLAHDAKYTDTEWGWDYYCVLDDKTTRVQRVFVSAEGDIEAALSSWLNNLLFFRPVNEFDSSLVNSPIDGYLNRPDERPHLWK